MGAVFPVDECYSSLLGGTTILATEGVFSLLSIPHLYNESPLIYGESLKRRYWDGLYLVREHSGTTVYAWVIYLVLTPNVTLEYYIYIHSFANIHLLESWDSAFGIATNYGLGGWGVRVWIPVGAIFFSSPCHPDRFWGPPSLSCNGYWGMFPLGIKQLTTHLQLAPSSRIVYMDLLVYIYYLIHLHGVMLN
jgi:hypothetical protein